MRRVVGGGLFLVTLGLVLLSRHFDAWLRDQTLLRFLVDWGMPLVLVFLAAYVLLGGKAGPDQPVQAKEPVQVKQAGGKPPEEPAEEPGQGLPVLTVQVVEQRAKMPEELRRNAIEVSRDVLGFLAQRDAEKPGPPRPDTWQRDVEEEARYSRETLALYSLRYAADLDAVCDALAKMGLVDKELETPDQHLANPLGIRMVAERIGALAREP
jgi:hypothetical protein